jgi:phosphonate transport system substrate-binding protein
MKVLKFLGALCTASAMSLGASAQTADPAPTLTLAIVPQQSAAKVMELWSPLANYVSSQSGYRVEIVTTRDIPTFERGLTEGKFDLAYMNPHHYTKAHASPGYQAFANEAGRKIQGLLVVAKDSPITDIKELQGLTRAFPAPGSFAATMLPVAALKAAQISVTPRYVSSHDSVYLSVAKGLFPAGGGVKATLEKMPPEVTSKLRVLWTTAPYTPHAIAARPGLDRRAVAAIAAALYGMDRTPQGKAALETLDFAGFQKAQDKDWNDVRALRMD